MRVIFGEEFRQQLRRPGFAIFTILVAAMMLIAIPVTSFIVDLIEDDSGESEGAFLEMVGYVDLAGVLPAAEGRDWPKAYDDRAEGIEAIRRGEIETLFVLTPDYMETGEVEEYEPVGTGRNLWGRADEWDFEGFLRHKLAEGVLDTRLLSRITDPASYRRFEVAADGAVSEVNTTVEVGELVIPILFAVLLMMAVVGGSGALLRAVYEEKETRMVEMLLTSASPLSLMTGKLLALWTAGLIQTAAWVTVGVFAIPAIFDRIPNGGDLTMSSDLLAVIALAFVLGYLLFSVLAMFIATVVNSQQSANQYTGLLSLFVGLPVWMTGLWISISPDHILAQVFTYSPFSAPTTLIVRNAVGADMSSGEIALSLAIVTATALVLLWVTARVYRAGILLSGQPIRPRNVWTALRYAD